MIAPRLDEEHELTASRSTHRWLPWLGSLAAVIVTIALMLIVISLAPSRDEEAHVAEVAGGATSAGPSRSPGVHASIHAGDVSIDRSLPALSFALEPDQSLDMRLPPGRFSGEFDATFRNDKATRAGFGAEIEGGAVEIVWRGEVIARSSDVDPAAGRALLVMSDPVAVPARLNTVTFRFSSDGDGRARMRALWLPKNAQTPLPLPAAGSSLLDSDSLCGRMLFEKLNCIACHAPQSDELRATIAASPAPILGEVGSRARPDWIRAWLENPHTLKHDTAMPRLFADESSSRQTIEDLVHFLASMGGPLIEPAQPADVGLAATGQILFHQVGCFACHGSSIDENGSLSSADDDAITSLGELHAKTTASALAAFIRDPLAVRPSGRMPSLDLQPIESSAIAHYLMSLGDHSSQSPATFSFDQSRVPAGRESFASLGCANCHALGPNRPPIRSTLAAPSLESIASSASTDSDMTGCIAHDWKPGTPRFALESTDRQALAAFLAEIAQRRSTDIPHDRLASALVRLNCLACHRYQDEGGPAPQLARHFTTIGEADLGDEGRLPPPLTDVGAKLNSAWLNAVLMDHGRVRPYLAVRMPHFGESVSELTSLFAAACGADDRDLEPAFTDDLAGAGRTLVGSGGLNCLQCHSIAGRAGTGTPGVDLANTVERLRYGYFDRWLHDPSQLSPGTRMPTFFVDGVSGITDSFDGNARQQIDAMWCYLSQGEMLPLPDGLLDPSSLQLDVVGEPLVFRTFMKEAGVRAIACGFPEQIHCAFDSESCAITAAWEGEFMNASGAWAGRGGTETNPKSMAWTAARRAIVGTCGATGAFTPAATRFDGYRLDDHRRPIFLFRAQLAEGELVVEHQPVPQRRSGAAALLNRMTLRGPSGATVCINVPAAQGEDIRQLQLDRSGEAHLEWEISW